MIRSTIVALLLVAVTSCSKDDNSSGGGDSLAVSFTSSISSRVSGTEWEAGDQIGIMVTSDNAILVDKHYNNLHNVTFTDPEQGIFIPATELDQIYYSVDESVYMDFYAYYPYSADLVDEDESYPIDITNQTVPKKIDFMEASTRGSGGYNKLSGDVVLSFTRNMSKITLILKAGVGVELSDITAVRLEGFSTTATYDFTNNEFIDFSGDDTDITPYDEGGNTYSAIVIPEEATNHKVYFMTTHGEVPLDITDSKFDLDKGEHISLTVTVNQTESSYAVNKIYGWDDAIIDPDDSTFETE